MKTFILLVCLSIYSLGATLSIKVINIKEKSGVIYLGVYDKKEVFKEFDKSFLSKAVSIDSDTIDLSFKNIPYGQYCVSLFHDINHNKILDKNFLGIPKEGYGFSNNPNVFGEPSFDDAKFELSSDKKLTIEVKY